MSQPHVHSFYRIWFTIVDPIVLIATVISCIFFPAKALEMVIPPSIEAYNPISHGPLLWQTAALFGFMGVMFAVLLRASSDPTVWRIVQAATLGVDLSLIAVLYALLTTQGRLDTKFWVPGDYFNLGFTVWVALIRVAFLMGVGGGNATQGSGKKRV